MLSAVPLTGGRRADRARSPSETCYPPSPSQGRRADRARSPRTACYPPSQPQGRRAYKKRTPSPSQHNVKGMLPRVASLNEMRQRPTLPYSVPYSTIGSLWLNFRVRYETGWIPHDIITAMVYHLAATRGSINIAFLYAHLMERALTTT